MTITLKPPSDAGFNLPDPDDAFLLIDELVRQQTAENAVLPLFKVKPKTPGSEPWQITMNSYPNLGGGAGTTNHGVWLGWNAARFSGGSYVTGKAGLYMGFEDNYFDYAVGGDGTYGVEWYVGYISPDQTTVKPADFRPIYARVLNSDQNIVDREAHVSVDIGSGATGYFTVAGSINTGTELFVVHRTLGIYNHLPAYFVANAADAGGAGSVQVAPADGYAQIDLVAPGTGTGGHQGVIAFKDVDEYQWTIAGTTDLFAVRDTINNRDQISLTPGASSATALTTVGSGLAVAGKFGANGATPQARQAKAVTVTNAGGSYSQAQVQLLVDAANNLYTILYNAGLVA